MNNYGGLQPKMCLEKSPKMETSKTWLPAVREIEPFFRRRLCSSGSAPSWPWPWSWSCPWGSGSSSGSADLGARTSPLFSVNLARGGAWMLSCWMLPCRLTRPWGPCALCPEDWVSMVDHTSFRISDSLPGWAGSASLSLPGSPADPSALALTGPSGALLSLSSERAWTCPWPCPCPWPWGLARFWGTGGPALRNTGMGPGPPGRPPKGPWGGWRNCWGGRLFPAAGLTSSPIPGGTSPLNLGFGWKPWRRKICLGIICDFQQSQADIKLSTYQVERTNFRTGARTSPQCQLGEKITQ